VVLVPVSVFVEISVVSTVEVDREVSFAVAPTPALQFVLPGDTVTEGTPVLMAVMVPVASAPPPTSTSVSPTCMLARPEALARVRVVVAESKVEVASSPDAPATIQRLFPYVELKTFETLVLPIPVQVIPSGEV
jgi:hypothetical protein